MQGGPGGGYKGCYLRGDWGSLFACFIVALAYGYTYYAFVFLLLLPLNETHPLLQWLLFVVFHSSFALVLWSWVQTMITHPGSLEMEVSIPSDDQS